MRAPLVALVFFTACARDEPTSRPTPSPIVVPPAPAPVSPPPTRTPPPRAQSPVTGGLLIPLPHSDGNWVAAADPDTDRVYVVDLEEGAILRTVQLEAGDAPRRMVQLPDGRMAVTLARDAIAVFYPEGGDTQRIPVCALPRGIDYDARGERLLVACREGLLVEVPADGDRPSRAVSLPRDLRDVVVAGARVYVTRFKAAEVLLLDAELRVVREVSFNPAVRHRLRSEDTAAVAYRALAAPDGSLYVLHQLGRTDLSDDPTVIGGDPIIPTDPELPSGGYGDAPGGPGDCSRAVVAATLTRVTAEGEVIALPPIARGTLMVDVAARDGTFLVADAGSRFRSHGAAVRVFPQQLLEDGGDDCDGLMSGSVEQPIEGSGSGPVTSVAFDREGRPVALMNAPTILLRDRERIPLDVTSPQRHGHRLFHQDAGSSIACASCHPEGEDDGLVWLLPSPRRTPALGGGLRDTAPFHWAGDLATLDALFTEVFSRRMGGKRLNGVEATALADWMESIPSIAVPTMVDDPAVTRGAITYARACASCHAVPGAASVNVGTGGPLQTPPLRGLMFRAPYLHDGCASTLADRFGRCATPAHGAVPADEVADLIRYLETL